MSTPLKLGVLISGSGTNLQAIIDAIGSGELDAIISTVISSREGVQGITRAEKAGVETVVALNPEMYKDPDAVNERIRDELQAADVDYVVMAGYMRKLGTQVLDAFPDRVLNLHPALLPLFPGAHAIEDALAAGVSETGVTVHYANENYDEGPIIAQQRVEILPDDTIDSLSERVHAAEYEIYPTVLQQLAEAADADSK